VKQIKRFVDSACRLICDFFVSLTLPVLENSHQPKIRRISVPSSAFQVLSSLAAASLPQAIRNKFRLKNVPPADGQ
jgi:hypothetical protein